MILIDLLNCKTFSLLSSLHEYQWDLDLNGLSSTRGFSTERINFSKSKNRLEVHYGESSVQQVQFLLWQASIFLRKVLWPLKKLR